MISLDGVQKQYGDGTIAVQDLSIDIPTGEVCVLVGPSGCGKTTTMRMINRLVDPTKGTVYVDGKDVRSVDPVQLRRGIGYVIQAVGLFPHQTIRRNVGTVCRLLDWKKSDIDSRTDEMLELVGLDPATYGDRYPHQLSGGQRQRVGVARALAANPPVMLMDEPFGAVDPVARERLQAEFLRLQRDVGTTTVIVTHDIDEAVRLGDRIAVMKQGGYLEQYDTPAQVLGRPASDFVAEFVGADRLLKLMAVMDVESAHLGAIEPGENLPTVPDSATLREASVAILDSATGRVLVTDDSGTGIGTLTFDGVRDIVAANSSPVPVG